MSPGMKKRRKRWPAWSEEEYLLTVIGRKVCIGCPVSLVWWCVCCRSTSPLWMLNGRFSMTSWTGFTRAVQRWSCRSCPSATSPRSTLLTGEGLAWFGWPWFLRGCLWLGAGVGKHKTSYVQCLVIIWTVHLHAGVVWNFVLQRCVCAVRFVVLSKCALCYTSLSVCRNLFCAA